MVSLSLAIGRWALSFELGRAEEAADPVEVVTLGDGTEVADVDLSGVTVAFGFAPWGSPGYAEVRKESPS